MSLVVYNDVVLPHSVLAAGVRGRRMRNNTRTRATNGSMQVNVNWARTLREYQLGVVPMPLSTWQTIAGLHEVTEGGAYGFLMSDPTDSSVLSTEGLLQPVLSGVSVGAIGLGYGIPTYQLHKRYASIGSTRTKDRKITRPVATPVVLRGGVPVTHGAGAGNLAINYETGLVTFVADSSSSVTAFTAGATTQITLAAALAGVAVGERLYLDGIVGTSAGTLNGLSHAITAITGAGLNVYTLSVNTTGLTRTSGGTGFAYPQATETLTWSGSFYVPVHFASDDIDWEMVRGGPADSRLLAGPSVVLNEVRE